MFFDMLAVPADAPHPRNAHLFIDYMLRPEVAAKNSSTMHYTTSNAAAYKLVDPAVKQRSGGLSERGTEGSYVSESIPEPGVYT